MKKILFVFLFVFVLASCGKNIENTEVQPQDGTTSEQEVMTPVEEEIEDPNDITTQKWYKERISERKNALETFFTTLESYDQENKNNLPCGDYYATSWEYFDSLYEEEQNLIKEYFTKCESLKDISANIINDETENIEQL